MKEHIDARRIGVDDKVERGGGQVPLRFRQTLIKLSLWLLNLAQWNRKCSIFSKLNPQAHSGEVTNFNRYWWSFSRLCPVRIWERCEGSDLDIIEWASKIVGKKRLVVDPLNDWCHSEFQRLRTVECSSFFMSLVVGVVLPTAREIRSSDPFSLARLVQRLD